MRSYKKHSHLLARVNFPLYTVRCLSERHILVAGGGGGAKTGIRNVIAIYETISNGSTCRAELITQYETGNEAIMNCAVYNSGKYLILFAGMEGNCQIFKIKHEILNDAVHLCDEKVTGEESETLRQRSAAGSKEEPSSSEKSSLKKGLSTNGNSVYSRLHFNIHRLESFQTDFSDDPFQKLVRFSVATKVLATAGADGHIRIWKYPVLNKILDIKAHADDVDDMDICPFGKKIVSVSRDGYGKVWDAETGSLITDLTYELPAKCDGKYIFRSCRFGIVEDKKDFVLFATLNPAVRKRPAPQCFICKFDTVDFSLEKITSAGSDLLSVMTVSDNGHFLGLGTQEGSVKIYIAFSLQVIYSVNHIHGIFVTGLEFLPSCEESRRITGGHEASLLSISVDNHIIIHHIPNRASMGMLTLITLFIITLFFIFVIMDYFRL